MISPAARSFGDFLRGAIISVSFQLSLPLLCQHLSELSGSIGPPAHLPVPFSPIPFFTRAFSARPWSLPMGKECGADSPASTQQGGCGPHLPAWSLLLGLMNP